MVPTADHVEGDIYRVYFSGRDQKNRSIITYFLIDLMKPEKILELSPHPTLMFGELGCFDDNGVTPASVVNLGKIKRLYYIGWKPRSTTRMSLMPGAAESSDGGHSFNRISRAPILHQTDQEPYYLLTAPFVLKDKDEWKMWYVSGVEWVHADQPRYNIKFAHSMDGLKWVQTGSVCIDFKNKNENALARPCVLIDEDTYCMWYSYKSDNESYRIGYAESDDGFVWERLDQTVGIDVSDSGWDSEMIEYACVLKHKGQKFMFFNGNGYGSTGIGLAIEK
jgi:hypothetical protein